MNFLTWLGQAGVNQYTGSLAAVNQWAQAEGKTECPGRGEENVELIAKMFDKFYNRNNKVPKDAYMILGAASVASEVALATAIDKCVNFQNLGIANDDYFKFEFRRAVKMMYGVALNMSNWAYPACCYYYTAQKAEAQEGASKDFTSKHLASTSDEKSSVQIARIRATPVPQRNVTAYGNILTAHSGAIKKDKDTDSFVKEIKTRQQEFTDTHILLCNYFVEQFLNLDPPPPGRFTLIDGVTFISSNALEMFEFYTAIGGGTPDRREGEYFVHYSVSATKDGKGWAAHHLARAVDSTRQFLPVNCMHPAAAIPNTEGYTAIDGATYIRDL
jgi:hypothetical protein